MANSTNNNTYAVLIEFEKWYKKQNIKYPYASALKTVQKDIYNYLKENPWNVKQGYEHEVSQFAKKAILHPTKSYDFIEAVDSLLKEGDYLYARTIVEEISYIAENIKKAIGKSTFNNKCSALKQFRKYLETDLSGLKVTGTYNNHIYRDPITKPMLAKIDGIVALANEIGEDKFIKWAIEQSYFFASDIVVERMDELIRNLANNPPTPLPARKTTKNGKDAEGDYRHEEIGGKLYYCEKKNNIKIPITLSKDGNDFVRSLISNETGFTVGAGKDTIFQNYIISHLWGRAYDPRYYTNFWNIVLVPAWANSLLDKNGEEGSLASKLKATFMAISKKLYMAKGVNWNGLNMTEPNKPNNDDGRKGDYSIKILCKKDNKDKCKPIKNIDITLR